MIKFSTDSFTHFSTTADRVARALLAKHPSGFAMNGSSFATVAGETGYQAVTATDIAREMQEEARKLGRRWKNCTHETVGRALEHAGWSRLYVARKNFYFLDYAELVRMRESYSAKKASKRSAWKRRDEERKALRESGGLVTLRVEYKKPNPYARWTPGAKGREFNVPAAAWLDEAAKRGAKAYRVTATYSEDHGDCEGFYAKWVGVFNAKAPIAGQPSK